MRSTCGLMTLLVACSLAAPARAQLNVIDSAVRPGGSSVSLFDGPSEAVHLFQKGQAQDEVDRLALGSSCRIMWSPTAKSGKTQFVRGQLAVSSWKSGTGIVFEQDQHHLYVLTAAHLVYGTQHPSMEFVDHTQQGNGLAEDRRTRTVTGEVIFCEGRGTRLKDDIAIVRLPKRAFDSFPMPQVIPLAAADDTPFIGTQLKAALCPGGSRPLPWSGVVEDFGNDWIACSPGSHPGASGSGVLDSEGTHIFGILVRKTDDDRLLAVSNQRIHQIIGQLGKDWKQREPVTVEIEEEE